MFDTLTEMEASVASLRIAALQSRPVTTADTRLMEVPGALADLFPEGGIRRGSTVSIDPALGGSTLALTLAAAVTGREGWVAALGLPSLGLVAAAEMGVRLDRLALIPDPAGQWVTVAAALMDGFDLLLLHPTIRVQAADARRLTARARERGAVMALMGDTGWPESPDIRLSITRSVWKGLGAGHGHLQSRELDVVASGRRAAGRPRKGSFHLSGNRALGVAG